MLFVYKGPVFKFDKEVIRNWTAITEAPSKEKALNNLTFRAKKVLNLAPHAKLKLSPSNLTKKN